MIDSRARSNAIERERVTYLERCAGSPRALIRAIVVVDAILAVVRACADDGAGMNGRETGWR